MINDVDAESTLFLLLGCILFFIKAIFFALRFLGLCSCRHQESDFATVHKSGCVCVRRRSVGSRPGCLYTIHVQERNLWRSSWRSKSKGRGDARGGRSPQRCQRRSVFKLLPQTGENQILHLAMNTKPKKTRRVLKAVFIWTVVCDPWWTHPHANLCVPSPHAHTQLLQYFVGVWWWWWPLTLL